MLGLSKYIHLVPKSRPEDFLELIHFFLVCLMWHKGSIIFLLKISNPKNTMQIILVINQPFSFYLSYSGNQKSLGPTRERELVLNVSFIHGFSFISPRS